MATIKQVADRAGVSSATVSRVLNGDTNVSTDLRERVVRASAELGYRPNRVARSLRRRTTETVGVVVSDIENPHFTSAVRAMEDAASARNYRLMLCNTDETAEKQRTCLEMLAAERVVGIILVPADPADPTISSVVDSGIPIVAFDRSVNDERVDAVFADNHQATARATEHLVSVGRRRIGLIGGRPEIQTGAQRQAGYEAVMARHGLESAIAMGLFRIDPAQLATARLLDDVPDLDGLVVANNLMAIGALRALRDAGRVVADDVALVAIDDPPWAEFVAPPMTTLAQPTRQMATSAVELLADRISGQRTQARSVIYHFELVVRRSCGMVRDPATAPV